MQENDAEQIVVEYVSAPREYEDLVNGTPEEPAETANGHDNSARTGKTSLALPQPHPRQNMHDVQVTKEKEHNVDNA